MKLGRSIRISFDVNSALAFLWEVKMPLLGFLFLSLLQGVPFFVSSALLANEDQRIIIQNALNVSHLTGRPILAVAGSNS